MNEPQWDEWGPLTSVTDYCWPVEESEIPWVVAIRLDFDPGSVLFEAVADDDTITFVVPALGEQLRDPEIPGLSLTARTRSGCEPWSTFIGLAVLWARKMVNHHGYFDGYQMEFATKGGAVGDCVEIIAIASSLRVGTAKFE